MAPDFVPLGKLLKAGDAGEREFRQIVKVLLSRKVPDEVPVCLGPALFTAEHLLCVSRVPEVIAPEGDKPDEFLEQLYNETADTVCQQVEDYWEHHPPTDFIVIDPIGDSEPEQATDAFGKFLRGLPEPLRQCPVTTWSAENLRELLLEIPPLALRYYPESVPDGPQRLQAVKDARKDYDREFAALYGKIQFVGMSVYKEEATAGVDMDAIYIPLRIVPEATTGDEPQTKRTDPIGLLSPGGRHVILGDPGAGKSTLLRFLGLVGSQPRLRERFGTEKDDRLPVLVILRQYADELKTRPELDLLDYIVEAMSSELELDSVDREFFDYYFCAGRAVLLLDGVDELPGSEFKSTVRSRVADLLRKYPGNTTLVSSRIIGYDKEDRYDELNFSHHQVARLEMEDIQQFGGNW